ncbi:MAG: transcriptional repressor [Deinococcus sp.]|nr:transcriptional repressor [Deinococcus sp.]
MGIKRLTKQRKAVLEVVRHANNHPDAAWVYQRVRERVPSISLGTVYRTLDALVDDGYLLPLTHSGEATRYEANLDGHLHLVCSKCGEFVDISHPLPDLLSGVKERYPELDIHAVQVEYQGLCQGCRTRLQS